MKRTNCEGRRGHGVPTHISLLIKYQGEEGWASTEKVYVLGMFTNLRGTKSEIRLSMTTVSQLFSLMFLSFASPCHPWPWEKRLRRDVQPLSLSREYISYRKLNGVSGKYSFFSDFVKTQHTSSTHDLIFEHSPLYNHRVK